MTIDSWITIWTVLLVAGIVLFALLAVCVTIGGFFDVRRLFATLRQQHAADEADKPSKDNGTGP